VNGHESSTQTDDMLGFRWLYAVFRAIDADFRMVRRNVSSDMKDPSLNDGSAFFVKEYDFKKYLAEFAGLIQQEVTILFTALEFLHSHVCLQKSTCVNHKALSGADKDSRGLAATGIGTVDCARHNMKQPCGVGDLQKGER
jgi:Kyakuja-Dileera-Zisupton transposase